MLCENRLWPMCVRRIFTGLQNQERALIAFRLQCIAKGLRMREWLVICHLSERVRHSA